MPGMDWIPGLSQAKSFCQVITGDKEGARRTQENFLKQCPVVSQVTSGVQMLGGDQKGAEETQKQFLNNMNYVTNEIPVVGHVKGAVHHALGDTESGKKAWSTANRSTVVVGSGIAAGVASGGIAAIPAAIAAGSVYDIVDTAISEKPKGILAAVDNAKANPNTGNMFDAAAGIATAGLGGSSGYQTDSDEE